MESKVNIFEYTDYRKYLSDWRDQRLTAGDEFSYRWFSSRGGFSSPNFLKLVIDNKRNLSKKSIPGFRKALSLSGLEAKYFEALVHINQARTYGQKQHWCTVLTQLQKKVFPEKLNSDRYEFYSNWYVPVVRELMLMHSNIKGPEDLLKKIVPKITLVEAHKAFQILIRLNLIKQMPDGSWGAENQTLTTGDEVTSVAIKNYQKTMIELGAAALESFSPQERDISSLTLSLDEEQFKKAKKMIQQFRQSLLTLEKDTSVEREVLQVNFQLFPLTRVSHDEA